MLKSVFKEIIIVLLLIIAIIILLAVLFYDYMPSSKIVPTEVETYKLADDVKAELQKDLDNQNSEEIIKTYQLDAIQIEHYEKTKEYNKGKVNPFSEYNTGTTPTNNNSSTSNGQSINNGSSGGAQNTQTNSNSTGGTFLNTVGK